jgi:hypothetical protein
MLNDIMLSVTYYIVMLNIIVLSNSLLSALFYIVLLNVIMLSDVMLILSAIMLYAVMLSVVVLSVVMLNVVAPCLNAFKEPMTCVLYYKGFTIVNYVSVCSLAYDHNLRS